MALQDRIEKIKPFFKGFNVDAKEGVSVLLVKFPDSWQIPGSIVQAFKLQTETRQEGIYFVTETENGIEGLFDAVDYVIQYNQSIIEKSELLREKIGELKDIFVRESIEKLKSLQFTFGDKPITPKKNVKGGKKTTDKKVKEEPTQEEETVKTPIVAEENDNSSNNDDNDLMSLAKRELGE